MDSRDATKPGLHKIKPLFFCGSECQIFDNFVSPVIDSFAEDVHAFERHLKQLFQSNAV
jgi:hypothetical protein